MMPSFISTAITLAMQSELVTGTFFNTNVGPYVTAISVDVYDPHLTKAWAKRDAFHLRPLKRSVLGPKLARWA